VAVSDGKYDIGLDLKRKGNALKIGGDALGVTISIDELGVSLKLANGSPSLQFFAHDTKVVIKPTDSFLKLILGDGITIGLDVVAQADAAGKLRLINGTGLRASLPVPTLPTGPFDLQLINLGLDPEGGSFSGLRWKCRHPSAWRSAHSLRPSIGSACCSSSISPVARHRHPSHASVERQANAIGSLNAKGDGCHRRRSSLSSTPSRSTDAANGPSARPKDADTSTASLEKLPPSGSRPRLISCRSNGPVAGSAPADSRAGLCR